MPVSGGRLWLWYLCLLAVAAKPAAILVGPAAVGPKKNGGSRESLFTHGTPGGLLFRANRHNSRRREPFFHVAPLRQFIFCSSRNTTPRILPGRQHHTRTLPHRVYIGFPMNELRSAVLAGSIKRIIRVLSRGLIGIDEVNSTGSTPLIAAALFRDSLVVRTLLDRGADVTIADHTGATALHMSANRGHLAVTELLLMAGADTEVAVYVEGFTPLRMAAQEGHLGVVVVLIDAGADLNSRAFNGTSVLYSAACNGHLDVVKVLLRAGANPLPSYTNPSGHT